MSKYKESENITLPEVDIKFIRNKFNSWCQAEEGYAVKNLGDLIKITKTISSPLYEIELKKQTDSRHFENFKRPAPLSDIDRFHPTITSFDQLNIHDPSLTPTDFLDCERNYEAEKSFKVNACSNCNASGRITCPECHGRGRWEEYRTRFIKCTRCGGTGTITHETTEPESRWETVNGQQKQVVVYKKVRKEERCTSCGGRGGHEERYKELVICDTCGGAGKIDCPECKGEGAILRGIKLVQRLETYTSHGYWASYYPKELKDQNFTNEFNRKDVTITDVFDARKMDFDTEELGKLPLVGPSVLQLLEKYRHTQSDVCFSRITIREYPCIYVYYEYEEKTYVAVMLGRSGLLYAHVSPISEAADKLRIEAQQYIDKGHLGKAHRKMQQLLKFGQATDAERLAMESLEARMSSNARRVSWWGMLLSSILIFPFVELLLSDAYNIVAPWTELLYRKLISADVDAVIRTLIGFMLADGLLHRHIPMPKFIGCANSPVFRDGGAFLSGIVLTLIAVPAILLANYLGILSVLYIIVFLAVTLFYDLIRLIIKWMIGLF